MRPGVKPSKFCRRGHNKDLLGRTSSNQCQTCIVQYRLINKEKIRKINRNYYVTHVDKELQRLQNYRRLNKAKVRQINRDYVYNRKQTDIEFKIKSNLRTRLVNAINENQKKGSAVRDLGCSIDFLKQYIESKFYSNMSWSNWGSVWELDHIVPLYKIDLTNRKQLLKAVHYANLQPLTIKDHRKKTVKDLKR